MPFKINISDKGKTFKIESESEALVGKKIGETLTGEDLTADLAGYELQITGTTDNAGFAGFKEHEGPSLKKVLLTHGRGMRNTEKGLRLKKTIRGNTISKEITQINTIVKKSGPKKLEEIFKKEEKAEAGEAPAKGQPAEQTAETPAEEKPAEKAKPEQAEKKPEEKKK